MPHAGAANRRLENRVLGVDCNPYLAIAASLATGYLGMVKQIEPSAPTEGEREDGSSTLPNTIDKALTAFDEANDIHSILAADFCQLFAEVKREEMRELHREISPWEREHLLLNV